VLEATDRDCRTHAELLGEAGTPATANRVSRRSCVRDRFAQGGDEVRREAGPSAVQRAVPRGVDFSHHFGAFTDSPSR
jgi:hypothetical protein